MKNDCILSMANKFNDPKAAPKTYWSILNRFLHNEKLSVIPPLLVNGISVSDFCTKTNLFNDLVLVSICTPANNGSTMPPFIYKIDVWINCFRMNDYDISLIIKNDYDNIWIRIIQIYSESIAVPLKLLLETALKEKRFHTFEN